MITLIPLIIFSGIFAQNTDIVPTPEQMDQLLNDSTIEQVQTNVEQKKEPKKINKKNKRKMIKEKGIKTKGIKPAKIKKAKNIKKTKKAKKMINGGENADE
ncbi:MAG: hypothetical protein NTY22_02255 [Proteobacteria bacterium]|nr:hypothetical protein [Pseudomonadota bacterium]